MLNVENPIVSIGEPFEIRFETSAQSDWPAVTGIRVALMSESDEVIREFTFQPSAIIKIPTDNLQLGTYQLDVALNGTPLHFVEPVIVGVPDLRERMNQFVDALQKHKAVRAGDQNAAGLREVEAVYRRLGLFDLALEVKEELRPFEKGRVASTHVATRQPVARPKKGKYEYSGTGRRKKAVARAHIRVGSGTIFVSVDHDRIPMEEYFVTVRQQHTVREALMVTELEGGVDVLLNCSGGGKEGQANASRLAIAKALRKRNEDVKPRLRAEGLITTDARQRERKKYGQKGARKRFQFSKR